VWADKAVIYKNKSHVIVAEAQKVGMGKTMLHIENTKRMGECAVSVGK
tara:strand:- start:677 stop:820 length:144 start_codon:yes stop_codon:yes gene_type:complete